MALKGTPSSSCGKTSTGCPLSSTSYIAAAVSGPALLFTEWMFACGTPAWLRADAACSALEVPLPGEQQSSSAQKMCTLDQATLAEERASRTSRALPAVSATEAYPRSVMAALTASAKAPAKAERTASGEECACGWVVGA